MFADRTAAGEALAERLKDVPLADAVVLALPRGGVPVALPVARALQAPLDLLLVRKIGMPGNPELAAGAVAEGAEPVFNDGLLHYAGLEPGDFGDAVARARADIADRRQRYLDGRGPEPVLGRPVVVVDDGIATGATMRAALEALAGRKPGQVILAVPVAPPDAVDDLRPLADSVICLETPDEFWAVGAHYTNFMQLTGADVTAAMAAAGETEERTKDA